MKIIYSLPFLMLAINAHGQTFYVQTTEKGFEKEISSKLDFNNFKTTENKSQSDFIVSYHYQKNRKNYKFEGYINIVETPNENEIFRTEVIKKPANAFNGYQALPQIISLACEKYLLPELKNNIDKYKTLTK